MKRISDVLPANPYRNDKAIAALEEIGETLGKGHFLLALVKADAMLPHDKELAKAINDAIDAREKVSDVIAERIRELDAGD